MINQVYQLVSPRQFEATFKTIDLHNHNSKLLFDPYICQFVRFEIFIVEIEIAKILSKKLPMSLIRESVGEIVYDSEHRLKMELKLL